MQHVEYILRYLYELLVYILEALLGFGIPLKVLSLCSLQSLGFRVVEIRKHERRCSHQASEHMLIYVNSSWMLFCGTAYPCAAQGHANPCCSGALRVRYSTT